MAKSKQEGAGKKSVKEAESVDQNFRLVHKTTGAPPNSEDTGAGDKVTTPQRYKKGGSVKGCTTPYPW
jgi:hypothetical protein